MAERDYEAMRALPTVVSIGRIEIHIDAGECYMDSGHGSAVWTVRRCEIEAILRLMRLQERQARPSVILRACENIQARLDAKRERLAEEWDAL